MQLLSRLRPKGFLVCVAMAAILTLVVGREVLFLGKTFAPTDFWTTHPLWGGAHATDAFVRNRNHLDIIAWEALQVVVAHDSLRRGELLLWNPYTHCGLPGAADPQTGTFYLPRLILLKLLPPLAAFDGLILLQFFAAGPAMYALARAWGMKSPGALLAALTWMLCGHQMVWFKYSGGLPAAWGLPILALALRRGATEGSAGWMAAAGAVWALMLTGCNTQLALLAGAWAVVFLCSHLKPWGLRRTAAYAATFGVTAVGLAALQLFPFLSTLMTSQRLDVADSVPFSRPWRVPLLLVTLFWQRAFGSPMDRLDLTNAWTGTNFFEYQIYVGLLPLALGAWAWRRSPLLSWTALVVLAIGTFYPFWWVVAHIVPGFRILSPHRFLLFSFAISLLAGLGLDRLLEQPPPRAAVLRFGLLAAGVLLLGLVGSLRSATWLSLGNPAYAALAAAALLAVLALRVLQSPASPVLKLAVAGIAVGGDLLPGFLQHNPAYDPFPPTPPFVARLSREDRALVDLRSAYHKVPCDNFLMAYGVSTPIGYASQSPLIYHEMVRALGAEVAERHIRMSADHRRALRLLNVRAVKNERGEEFPDALPRGWIVARAETLPDPAERLRRLADPAFDPGRTVLLEIPPPPLLGEVLGSVERKGETDYEVSCDRPCLLVVSDTYDPGWRCSVDGRSRPVLRANHALRAVALEPGRHRVSFSYRPRSVIWGASVSAATLAVLLGWAILRRRARAAPDPSSTARSG